MSQVQLHQQEVFTIVRLELEMFGDSSQVDAVHNQIIWRYQSTHLAMEARIQNEYEK